jgi:hypothetical protein
MEHNGPPPPSVLDVVLEASSERLQEAFCPDFYLDYEHANDLAFCNQMSDGDDPLTFVPFRDTPNDPMVRNLKTRKNEVTDVGTPRGLCYKVPTLMRWFVKKKLDNRHRRLRLGDPFTRAHVCRENTGAQALDILQEGDDEETVRFRKALQEALDREKEAESQGASDGEEDAESEVTDDDSYASEEIEEGEETEEELEEEGNNEEIIEHAGLEDIRQQTRRAAEVHMQRTRRLQDVLGEYWDTYAEQDAQGGVDEGSQITRLQTFRTLTQDVTTRNLEATELSSQISEHFGDDQQMMDLAHQIVAMDNELTRQLEALGRYLGLIDNDLESAKELDVLQDSLEEIQEMQRENEESQPTTVEDQRRQESHRRRLDRMADSLLRHIRHIHDETERRVRPRTAL